MKRFSVAAGLSLALILAPIDATGDASHTAPDASGMLGEDLFKWGEYDSLIQVLEPAMAGSGLAGGPLVAADSALRAKSYLFLGVAFYATGKKERADSMFARACDLEPEVKLDRFYVTEEIANHFQAIALDGMRNRKQRTAVTLASLAMESRAAGLPIRIPPSSKPTGRADPGIREANDKGWLWWGLGVTALAAAGGGVYYITSKNESHPEDRLTTINAR